MDIPRRILALLEADRDDQPARAAGRKLADAFNAELIESYAVADVEALGADLVLKYSAYQSPVQRSLFTAPDWQLIRDCTSPLLLVKDPSLLTQPRILVCVDPLHANDKPAALDHQLLDVAELLADVLGGEVDALHVLTPRGDPGVAGDAYVTPATIDERSSIEHAQHALRELLLRHPGVVERGRVRIGVPSREIVGEARAMHAGLVVMGAVSRGRLARWLLGSTAETTLDRLACNVLVVKPPLTN